jgi:hypothetical protein
MAYLVVGVHNAYKIWCLRGAVKEKPGKNENTSNSFRGGDFYQDKTAIFSNGCIRPPIFSPPVRSGTRCPRGASPQQALAIDTCTGRPASGAVIAPDAPWPRETRTNMLPCLGSGVPRERVGRSPAAFWEAPPVRGHIPHPGRTVNFCSRISQQEISILLPERQ